MNYKIGQQVRIKDYSQWDNIEPFKRIVKRYTGRSSNGVMVVTGRHDIHHMVKISSSIEDSLDIGSIYVHPDHIEPANVCQICQEDITHDVVKHPVTTALAAGVVNGQQYICEHCNDIRLDAMSMFDQVFMEVD